MSAIRVSSVQYLNARPLVHGLGDRTDLFSLQFDVPAKCASFLHNGSIDLGLIPSIEYLRQPDYRIVPDIAIVSEGPVASVALFTKRPTTAIRSIAIDSGSRTAVALLRILCAQWFDIEPTFVTLNPDLPAMLKRCDAALLIGDTALFTDHENEGFDKVDLGDEWTAMTNLPFVWAFWTGRLKKVEAVHVEALRAARDGGIVALDEIATAYGQGDKELVERAGVYLHENVHYALTEQARAGLKKFFGAALDLGIVQGSVALRFCEL